MFLKKNGKNLIDFLKEHAAFIAIVILTIIFAYPYQEGISPFDPGNYCTCAVQLLRGEFDFGNFYCNRIGSYLPITLAIKIFGFNGYYLTWITVFELILLLVILYFAFLKYSKEIALIVCGLVGFAPLMLELSGTLYGDIMATLTCNLCILWIWHVRFISVNPKQILGGIVLVLMWFFALLTKEYGFYYLLPIVIIFISDKKNKQFNKFWNAALIFGLALGSLFLLIYAFKTGDLFHRLHIIENVPNKSSESYSFAPLFILLARITFMPLKLIIETSSYFIIFVFMLIHLVNKVANDKEFFLKVYVISLMILWWMGTQSLRSWTPLLLNDRLWLPLIVPMAINAAHVFYSIWLGDVKRYATWQTKTVLAIMGLAAIALGYINQEKFFTEQINPNGFITLRVGVVIFAFLAIFYRNVLPTLLDLVRQHYILVGIVSLPLIYNISTLITKDPRDNNYLSEQESINMVRQIGQKATILSETSVCKNRGIYYGFDSKVEQYLTFMDWSTTDTSLLRQLSTQQEVYLLITNDRLRWYIKNNTSYNALYPKPNENVPDFVLQPDQNWELLKQTSRTSLYRYKN